MDTKQTNSKQNKFFLISFIPALAYWYLEANYSLKVALLGGVALALIELALEYILFKHTHLISRINFGLILILGGISFLGEDGIWFKLQPMMTGVGMGLFLMWSSLSGRSIMFTMMSEIGNTPPKSIVQKLELHMGIFMFLYGCFMAYVALNLSTDQWVFWKTGGFYIVTLVFMGLEFVYMRFQAKKSQSDSLRKS